jgi:hypothetical protein
MHFIQGKGMPWPLQGLIKNQNYAIKDFNLLSEFTANLCHKDFYPDSQEGSRKPRIIMGDLQQEHCKR